MAIPTVGGGQQIGDGNANEVRLFSQGAPATATVTATLTAAQLATGIILGFTTASAMCLPTTDPTY